MAGRTLPVLLIIFNRPETTRQVFDAIRDYAPKALYIAGDGSRGTVWDDIRIQAAREVVRGVDWSCDIHHYYRDDNAGCRVNVLEAVSWFFANVDEGIILEDDVVPTPAFFSFCEAGLNHFRFDPRVAAIGGFTAHQPGAPYLSVHGSVWGWASWSAVWNSVLDPGAQINEYDLTAVLSVASIWTTLEKITIRERFSRATIDTWDYTCFHEFGRENSCFCQEGHSSTTLALVWKRHTRTPGDAPAEPAKYLLRGSTFDGLIVPPNRCDATTHSGYALVIILGFFASPRRHSYIAH